MVTLRPMLRNTGCNNMTVAGVDAASSTVPTVTLTEAPTTITHTCIRGAARPIMPSLTSASSSAPVTGNAIRGAMTNTYWISAIT